MNVILARRLTVDEFLLWLRKQDEGHYELERGRIVVLQAEMDRYHRVPLKIELIQGMHGVVATQTRTYDENIKIEVPDTSNKR